MSFFFFIVGIVVIDICIRFVFFIFFFIRFRGIVRIVVIIWNKFKKWYIISRLICLLCWIVFWWMSIVWGGFEKNMNWKSWFWFKGCFYIWIFEFKKIILLYFIFWVKEKFDLFCVVIKISLNLFYFGEVLFSLDLVFLVCMWCMLLNGKWEYRRNGLNIGWIFVLVWVKWF